LSSVVKTQFGYHLIMVTDRKAGRDIKFEDAKPDVQEIFSERMREKIVGEMRSRSKIAIAPVAKQ
jgi:parvulin-like peptidyl-prolyl isomerase